VKKITLNIEKIINPKPNYWKEVVKYINSHENFTRKDMCKDIENFSHTEDQYILIIKHVGFLEKPDTGSYIRKMKIPETLSLCIMTKLAYDISYADKKRKWKNIISRKEKLNKLNKI
jgi:hypothetical protein